MMTYENMVVSLEKEKELVTELNGYLEQELGYISAQDLQGLEESMPHKQKILRDIAANRIRYDMETEPDPEIAGTIRKLQQDLVVLWKKAHGFNELSKTLVSSRLNDIERQIGIFLSGLKGNYTRAGKKSRLPANMIKTGV
ncbi:MAG: flagellar export chaperone FlgN [Desulfomonilia bacterium]